MSDTFRNKYEQEAHAIVEDLKGTKWQPVIGPDRNEATASRTPNLVMGLLALALLAIWRLRR
jgi:MYXO-CTERM domain-containing protein